MSKIDYYTCPACGFFALEFPKGDSICNVCDWQDDLVQRQFSACRIGANKISLCEHQAKILKIYPLEIKETEVLKPYPDETKEIVSYKRDESWQILTPEDCKPKEGQPRNGKEWFDKMPGKRVTYIDGKYK